MRRGITILLLFIGVFAYAEEHKHQFDEDIIKMELGDCLYDGCILTLDIMNTARKHLEMEELILATKSGQEVIITPAVLPWKWYGEAGLGAGVYDDSMDGYFYTGAKFGVAPWNHLPLYATAALEIADYQLIGFGVTFIPWHRLHISYIVGLYMQDSVVELATTLHLGYDFGGKGRHGLVVGIISLTKTGGKGATGIFIKYRLKGEFK